MTPVTPGVNGDWDPLCLNGVNYCGYTSNQPNNAPTPTTDTAKFSTAARATWTNQGRSQGMADSEFLRGPQWKAWDGALAVAFLAGTRVEIPRLDASGAVTSTTTILDNLGTRIRAVLQGPDGALYVTTDRKSGGDEIWRIAPQ